MKIKKIALLFVFLNLICQPIIYSQKYNAIDSVVLKYPNFGSIDKLAKRIQKDFTSEHDKARAIYSWIALNLNYDLKAYLNPPREKSYSFKNEDDWAKKLESIDEKTIQKAFKSRKAVCEGFSLLYAHLGSLVGLKCQVINGDSKTQLSDIGRKRLKTSHAWNTVLIDGKWALVDVTWGQGYYDLDRLFMVKDFSSIYFDQNPKFFYAKHFPNEWMNSENIEKEKTFLNAPLIYKAFIKVDCEIITPNSGVIQANDGDEIIFKIKNISKFENFYYLDIKGNHVEIVNPKEENGLFEFKITYNKNLGKFINFYLFNEGLVTFKIIPRTI